MPSSASQLLHAHVGAPPVAECAYAMPFACWVCGSLSTRGMRRDRWMGHDFTGQNRVRAPASSTVCEACVWAMAGRPPDTLRMYSNLLDVGGEYLRVNKGAKPAMRAWLRAPKLGEWFAAIADSGQKHVVPWAPVNPAGSRGRVAFEDSIVHMPDERGWLLVDEVAALLTAGATKEEVERGDYSPRAWTLAPRQIRDFERERGGERGGTWFALAAWLAQRDESVVAVRMAAEKATKEAKKRGR